MNNILISSVGTRGYIVEHFKEAAKGQYGIYAADALKYAPALKNADKAFVLPLASDKNYIKMLIKLCKENGVKAVFSINDVELPWLASYKEELLAQGINAVVCDKPIIDMCTDKYLTYEFCKTYGVNAPKTYLWTEKTQLLNDISKGLMEYPIVAKPRRGSKSIGIKILKNSDELLEDIDAASKSNTPDEYKCMYQERLKGVLVAAHVLCNKKHEPVSIVTMKNLTEHFGETYQNTTYRDPVLFDYVYNTVKHAGAYGIFDLNIMQRDNGEYVLLEFNPRISGGYSLSHYANPDFTQNLLNIAVGIDVQQKSDDIYKFDSIIMYKQYSTTWTSEDEINKSIQTYL